ncbi:MAG: PCMD domain-containing protein [Rikenellaceae bacterium]|nr:PCMD domain-containing protein [Rikenellaceae bacterium]
MKRTFRAIALFMAFALPAIGFLACDDNEDPVVLSDAAEILSVTFAGQPVVEIQPRLDEETVPARYIFYVRHDVDNDDINALIPTIEISPKARLTPEQGKAADFSGITGTVRYTVTAEDGTMQHYDLVCAKLPSDEAYVMTVEIEEEELVLTQPRFEPGDDSATFMVKAGTTDEQKSALTPVIKFMGDSITPESGEPQDFTSGSVVYTVTAENGTDTFDFTLYCETELYTGTEILEMLFDSELVVDQPAFDDNEITFYVASSATTQDIADLAPSTLTLSPGATANYPEGKPPGFEDGVPVEYIITAENGDQDFYYVTCIRIQSNQAYVIGVTIQETELVESQPEMESGDQSATFILKAGTPDAEKASLTPVIEYIGQSISPESGVARDFTSGSVAYTVYAEDGTEFHFTLQCETALFTGNEILEIAFDPDKISKDPEIDGNQITVVVSGLATDSDISALAPTVLEISEGATVNYPAGTAPGFVDGIPVEYIVTAENGEMNSYWITVKRNIVYYEFEDWYQSGNYSMERQWWNANQGVNTAISMGAGIPYPTTYTTDAYSGEYAAELSTYKTAEGASSLIPGLVAGNMYLGGFYLGISGIANPLVGTKFGIPWYDKPLKVVGKFKYIPGDPADFYNNKTADPGNYDSFAMTAMLYEVDSYGNYNAETQQYQSNSYGTTLTGDDMANIENNARIVALKQWFSTDTYSDFTDFELELDYTYAKQYDPTKMYKFCMIFSSSKDGATYKGAAGSVLIVDEIRVINE